MGKLLRWVIHTLEIFMWEVSDFLVVRNSLIDNIQSPHCFFILLFYRPVDGTFQCEYLGEQLVDSCPQLSGLGGHFLELLPLLLDTLFQLRKLLLPCWLLPHAPGHQVLEFLYEVLPRLPLDQLP